MLILCDLKWNITYRIIQRQKARCFTSIYEDLVEFYLQSNFVIVWIVYVNFVISKARRFNLNFITMF